MPANETQLVIRFFSREELVQIDSESPLVGDTGASQEPGLYWCEMEGGEIVTGPCGPYISLKEAAEDYI